MWFEDRISVCVDYSVEEGGKVQGFEQWMGQLFGFVGVDGEFLVGGMEIFECWNYVFEWVSVNGDIGVVMGEEFLVELNGQGIGLCGVVIGEVVF